MRLPANGLVPSKQYGFLTWTPSKQNTGAWTLSYTDPKTEETHTCEVSTSVDLSVLGRTQYRVIGREDGDVDVIRYAPLHQHTDNSLKDALTTVDELVAGTEYAGAITDHGVMYGFLSFYKAMLEAGKKPIIGIEAYMAELDGTLARRHVILLAKNLQGYHNLLKLASESSDHFHYVPQITWEMLEQYHEGIICLSSCLGGIIPRALVNGDRGKACAAIERFIEIFGKEDFYIEIQNHGIPDEDRIRPQLVALAKEYGLKYVATTDAHYPDPSYREAHQVLLCLHDKTTMDDPNKRVYQGDGYYLHTSEQMEKRFAEYPEALDASLEITEKCDLTIPLGKINLPNYQFPAPFKDADEYMLHLAKEGFQTRFAGTEHLTDPVYLERFQYEIDIITKMGFCAYFIIIWDFINYARSQNIPVGPGRGSAAGSLIAYCMGITDMDPIRYNLLFERFLNPSRVSMPDIDTDIADTGRPQVIQYLVDKYGQENVCRIITFSSFSAKAVVKDVARVLGLPASFGNNLTKMMPAVTKSLQSALEESPELLSAYEHDQDTRRVIDLAKQLENRKRHASLHACFDGNTLITTDRGKKFIRNIKPGDMVLTHTGKYQKVVDTMTTQSSDIHRLMFSNGQEVVVTGNHPLLAVRSQIINKQQVTQTCGWTPVSELQEGAMVVSRTEYGMDFLHIIRHEVLPKRTRTMYNLTVLNDSSYVANTIVAHNCGVVIAPSAVSDYLPTIQFKDEKTDTVVVASQVDKNEVEPLSLIKMDLLGLQNLSAIDETLESATHNLGQDAILKVLHLSESQLSARDLPRFQDIPLNDRETYQMLANGQTGAVFQLESTGMTKVIKDMLADVPSIPDDKLEEICFERLIAAVALYRPGPMDYIPDYIAGLRDPRKVHYDCPQEKEFLESTYGVIVYQEQLMHIARALAGYSLGDADLLRRACSKKKAKEMEKEHSKFIKGNKKAGIKGCVANGISEEVAEEIWQKMKKFAEYAFNRSHAACYAWLGYITAYLSCHFPNEFYAAMLNAFNDNSDKSKSYLCQANLRDIQLLPPDIQTSMGQFTAQKDGILYGLQGIAGIKKSAAIIVAEREENGPFEDLQDMYQRLKKRGATMDKKVIEALTYSGALQSFSDNKAALLAQYRLIEADYKANGTMWDMGQLSLFSEEEMKIPLPDVRPMSETDELQHEHEVLGLFLSKHPTDFYIHRAAKDERYITVEELMGMSPAKKTVWTVGLIQNLNEFYTKASQELMATCTLETKFASVPCVIFPRNYAMLRMHLQGESDKVFCVAGSVIADNKSEEDAIQFSIQQLKDPEQEFIDDARRVVVPINSKEEQDRLQAFAMQYPGPVHLTLLAAGKTFHPKNMTIADDPGVIALLRQQFGYPPETA